MKISDIEILHADGGWRRFSFLKVRTDKGIDGWAEFNESRWNQGLSEVIRRLAAHVVGTDPFSVTRTFSSLQALTRLASGGLNMQGIAAIENACLDIKGKALRVPVYELFGGSCRESLPLYWSHFGTFRARNADFFRDRTDRFPVLTLDDLSRLAESALENGWKAVKTNPLLKIEDRLVMLNPGFSLDGLDLGQNYSRQLIDGVKEQIALLRAKLGTSTGLALDVNFSLKTEGLIRLGRALEEFDLMWLEADLHEPRSLALLRRKTATPIASLESLHGRKAYFPYLSEYSADVAIIDILWNGFSESVRIANLAEMFEVNVAPHNFYGHLASFMSAHFCKVVPNFRIMEFEVDDVPWKDELVTNAPVVRNGEMLLTDEPGWGTEVVEEAVRSHSV